MSPIGGRGSKNPTLIQGIAMRALLQKKAKYMDVEMMRNNYGKLHPPTGRKNPFFSDRILYSLGS
jgi:hypothetical protein